MFFNTGEKQDKEMYYAMDEYSPGNESSLEWHMQGLSLEMLK